MIKNFDKVRERLLKAKQSRERIVIYADSDLDGVGSAIILREILKDFDNEIKVYFPDREKEGYGLNQTAINNLKDFGPALIFLLDCGIGNFKEIDEIKKYGFEVIIMDHHQILNSLPSADIIVDLHQEGEIYPFKEFANAGIMYKFAETVIDDKEILDDLLFVCALSTIADKVVAKEDNKEIIKKGLPLYKNSKRIGFNLLVERTEFNNTDDKELHLKIINPLNISDHRDHINLTYILLTSDSEDECNEIIDYLLEKNENKAYEKIKIINEVMDNLASITDFPPDFVFMGSKDWDPVAIGSAASEVLKKIGRPVFLYKISDDTSLGSARLPKGLNGVKALESAKDYLITYGGHPPACGFKFNNVNENKVRERLTNFYRQND